LLRIEEREREREIVSIHDPRGEEKGRQKSRRRLRQQAR
jgi:hypothetical protein